MNQGALVEYGEPHRLLEQQGSWFKGLYGEGEVPDVPKGRIDPDKPALILHSSGALFCRSERVSSGLNVYGAGSTSFPKPITISHRTFSQWAYTSCTPVTLLVFC